MVSLVVRKNIKTLNGVKRQRDVGALNAFAMSDIESGEEGKVHRRIEWRREVVTEDR